MTKTGAKTVIEDLEHVVAVGSSEKRADIMRRVTDLFLTTPTQLSADQITVFGDAINVLINRLELRARAELSERLASRADVPPAVIRRLACDESIEVAGPVLAGSECLTDDYLVEIAESKNQRHLSKIAERKRLSPQVTDVLVDRGDQDVVKKVAGNSGARFSSIGMSTMAMRADGDDELIEIISRRTNVPSLIFSQLLSYATDETRRRLLAARPNDTALVNQVLDGVSAQAAQLATTAKDWATAQRFVDAFGQDTALTRARLLEFADGGRVTEMMAALSALSDVPSSLIGRLICDQNGFGAMILCRSLNLDWSVVHAILSAGPNAEKHSKQLEELCIAFERVSVATARRLLSFWQGRMKARAMFGQ